MKTKSDFLSRHTRRKIAHDARRLTTVALVDRHGERALHILNDSDYNAALKALHADGKRKDLKPRSTFQRVVGLLSDIFEYERRVA